MSEHPGGVHPVCTVQVFCTRILNAVLPYQMFGQSGEEPLPAACELGVVNHVFQAALETLGDIDSRPSSFVFVFCHDGWEWTGEVRERRDNNGVHRFTDVIILNDVFHYPGMHEFKRLESDESVVLSRAHLHQVPAVFDFLKGHVGSQANFSVLFTQNPHDKRVRKAVCDVKPDYTPRRIHFTGASKESAKVVSVTFEEGGPNPVGMDEGWQ